MSRLLLILKDLHYHNNCADCALFQQEFQNAGHLDVMASSFNCLLLCTILLIKPQRHHRWRYISTIKDFFKTIARMKGHEEIIQTIGYTENKGTALCFPDSVQEPDKARLCVLAAELLMAKLEVEDMKNAASESYGQSIAVLPDSVSDSGK